MYRSYRILLGATQLAAVSSSDFYQRLGVSESATEADIRAAYRRKALQCHPDLVQDGPDKEVADKLFREISEAYQCLTNRTEKRRYDSSRKPKRTEAAAAVKKEEPHPSPVPDEQDNGDTWHRYNRFQSGYHVYYTKDKTNRTKGGGLSRNRSEDIFRKAFQGRQAEEVILDMHQALKNGAKGARTTQQVYGVNVSDVKEDVARAARHMRDQARRRATSPPEGLRVPKKPPSRRMPFPCPVNMRVPDGVSVATVRPTVTHPALGPTEVVQDTVTNYIPISISDEWWVQNSIGDCKDGREYFNRIEMQKRHNFWPNNQGMLYSWHRPF